jgi:hypothetical protein
MFQPDQANLVVLKDAASGEWLYFSQPRRVVCAWEVEDVARALRQVEEQALAEGLYAAGWISYEAAPAFDPVLRVHPMVGFPRLWFGLYNEPQRVAAGGGGPAPPRLHLNLGEPRRTTGQSGRKRTHYVGIPPVIADACAHLSTTTLALVRNWPIWQASYAPKR